MRPLVATLGALANPIYHFPSGHCWSLNVISRLMLQLQAVHVVVESGLMLNLEQVLQTDNLLSCSCVVHSSFIVRTFP